MKHNLDRDTGGKVTKRRKGRQRTREDIIRVATEEFAKHGYHGGRVDNIAARTATSKRMIYYYFGSKHKLYQAVLLDHYRKIRTAEANLSLDLKPPLQAIKELVHFTFDWYLENRRDVPLVMQENMLRGLNISDLPSLESMNSRIILLVEKICERGVASGDIRADVRPLDIYLSIAALSFFNISNRYTVSTIFGHDMLGKSAIKSRRVAVTDMILRYIAVEREAASSR